MVPAKRGRQLVRVLAELVGLTGQGTVSKRPVVGHETDHVVEQVPDVDLVLDRPEQEGGRVVRPLHQRLDRGPTDPPGEAFEPGGGHWIGRVGGDWRWFT